MNQQEQRDDEFYVGYLPSTAPGIKARVTQGVLLFTAIAFLVAFLVSRSQQTADLGTYDWGALDPFEGTLESTPFPTLVIDDEHHILVGQGKRGADSLIEEAGGHSGQSLKVVGAAIASPAGSMIEVSTAESSNRDTSGLSAPVTLGQQTIVGEIVDSKCYLGVMKPGRGKPHRACASLCIRGGIPPALLVRSGEGQQILLITDSEGAPLGPELLELVAEPVEVEGIVTARGDLLYLKTSLSTIRRSRD